MMQVFSVSPAKILPLLYAHLALKKEQQGRFRYQEKRFKGDSSTSKYSLTLLFLGLTVQYKNKSAKPSQHIAITKAPVVLSSKLKKT